MWNELILTNIIVIMAITIVVFGIHILVYIKKGKTLKDISLKDYINIVWKSLLLGYILAVLNITLISRIGTAEEGYNFLPFKGIEEMINHYLITYGASFGRQIDFMVGNILMLVPFGFLVPIVFKKMDKAYKVLGGSTVFIIIIEVVQTITKAGNFDIDDFIYNIVGVFFGYSIYLVYKGICMKQKAGVSYVIKGMAPFCLIGLCVVIIKIIHAFMPYGILPQFVLYKATESSAQVSSIVELDNTTYHDTVCKVIYDGEDVYLKNTEEKVFEYLGLDYTRYYDEDESGKDLYISGNGAYRLEVEDNGGFVLRNIANYNQYEKEIDEQNTDEESLNIDKTYVAEIKKNMLDMLKDIGVNLDDKKCYEELQDYPNVYLAFSGYDYNGKKIVKSAGIRYTKSGEIAEVYCYFSTYEKTNDKIRIISINEALDKILQGETGIEVDENMTVLSVRINWFDRSSKGYNFPVYEFCMIDDSNDIDNVVSWYVPAWEFEK